MKPLSGKKIFVGLSGGVDSAVSAALLQQQGADVVGVFIQGWYPPSMPCTWREDRSDAMRAAAHLHIPFYTLDASQEYKQGVIDYLLSEYKAGRTPNPDVMCNREVKFGAFLRFAKEHGADAIATGHYAHSRDGVLSRGVDPAKDQSYFLWAIPHEAAAMTLFPLGDLEKTQTRRLAKQFGIPQATKKDSQGICFLGSISVDEFLRAEVGATCGSAVDEQGVEVGTHEGAVLATLGERISLSGAKPGPWYVVAKDMQSNILTVAHAPRVPAAVEELPLTQVNWLTDPIPTGPVTAQYRYHGPHITGVLSNNGHLFTPAIPLPEIVAPGQSLVCYQGEQLLGGGIIGSSDS